MQVSQCADGQASEGSDEGVGWGGGVKANQERVTNLCLADKSRSLKNANNLTRSMNKSLTELQKLSYDSVTSSSYKSA